MAVAAIQKNRISMHGVLVWTLAALFFLYEFFSRTFIATLASGVMAALHLSATELSLIGAAYYLSYAGMQVPVGIMLDRFGIRKLLLVAVTACAFGILLFAHAYSIYTLLLSRLLMGFGSSFAFLSLLALALNWFPKRNFGFFSGATQILGAIGPILAGVPLVALMKMFNGDWRQAILTVVYAGALLLVLIALFLQDRPKKFQPLKKQEMHMPVLTSLKLLLQNNIVIWIMLYAFCCYASISLLGAIWGTYFFETHGMSLHNATLIISMIWIGLAIGSPLVGFISDHLQNRKTPLVFCALFGFFITLCLIFINTHNIYILSVLTFCLGFAGAGQTLSFVCMSEHVTPALRTTAMGLNNTAVMLGGAIITPLVGLAIALCAHNNAHLHSQPFAYAAHDFTLGFLIMPLLYLAASIIAWLKI